MDRVLISAVPKNASYVRWYKGRDCGPRSDPENSAKAPRGISEGPVGGETRSVSAVRHKTSIFLAAGLITLTGLISLTGCERPTSPAVFADIDVSLEDHFSTGEPPTSQEASYSQWWREFKSLELNALIEQLLAQNPDIAAASLRVLQSELTYANARNHVPLVSVGGGTSTNSAVINDRRDTAFSGELKTNVSWEADLWGRIRGEGDAAAATLLATGYDRDALISSLIANVVKSYIGLNFTRRNIQATERILATRRDNLAIAQQRFRLGVENTDAGTVKSAEENLTATQAELPALELEIITEINAIDALTGMIPSSRRSIQGNLPGDLPAFRGSVGTPIQALERRPDVRASMARLRAANANIAVSLADRFPTVTLSGSLNSSGEDLNQILDIDSLVAALVTDLTLTVLMGSAALASSLFVVPRRRKLPNHTFRLFLRPLVMWRMP